MKAVQSHNGRSHPLRLPCRLLDAVVVPHMKPEAEMKLHLIYPNRTIKTERPIALTRRDLRKLERLAEHCRQSGTPLHWMIREVALQRVHESHRKRPWWHIISWR